MVNARVYFLGTGAAMPITRNLPCLALKVDSEIYLLDPAEGCQGRLFRYGLSPLKIRAIFITHSHGDHYLGLPGLLQSMTLSGRDAELKIAAPGVLVEALNMLFKTGIIKPSFKVNTEIVKDGYLYRDTKIEAIAFPVEHSIEAYGYRISIGKKTICYTGDTAPSENTIKYCQGVDILIHDSTFTSEYESEARAQKHSTAADAAKIAIAAGVRLLVLFHVSARHGLDEVFYDAYRLFKNTVVAQDGLVIYL